ncbi:hypothetical protein CWB96_06345 [Pseudoalteromonas citrea]|uniref:Uncharacterized protein n=1 Tax=Pseudoalteromonas citrea TaxID=43655 RepID=A0A5S3XSM8_9GAMM|nr:MULTISPECIES: hypothetical protein [Pseudoalteromonas]RJE76974.1 hypothetical protein BGP78_01630 [Pseudoalteromonas sp. MSK9-3]TMP41806.1 hypothetical protein CWB97_13655 [Pseudoalteromonas citrea]TMP60583.1 hypothetical protein CWB96_06345 [Pseudoalteromonas citrea]
MANTLSLSARLASLQGNVPGREDKIIDNAVRANSLYRYLGIIQQVETVEEVDTPLPAYANPQVEIGQYVLLAGQAASLENGIYKLDVTGDLIKVDRAYDVGNMVDDLNHNNDEQTVLWRLTSKDDVSGQVWSKEIYHDTPPVAV